jgi:methyl-accepting chemotaxis protein
MSEEVSGPYGNVLGSELVATESLRRLGAQIGSSAEPLTRQWDELRNIAYLWVNAEAADGHNDLRISRMTNGQFRASIASSLVAPPALKSASSAELRTAVRMQTESLKDGSLRRIVADAEQAALVATRREDKARQLALNGTLASLLLSLLLAVAASIWLYRSIARPLMAARVYADRVADGDWAATFPNHRADEIGALTHAVENMKDAFVRKATIMSEMAGAVLVTSGQVDAAAKHAQQAVASGEISPTDLAADLSAVSARTETLTGLAAQMLQD